MIIEQAQRIQMPRRIINVNDFDEDSRLCCGCVTDHYLREKIRKDGEEYDCSFCDDFGPTFSLEEVAELVEQAFSEHFERTSTEPSDWDYFRIKEMDYEWDREGDQVHYVISEIAGIDEDVAEVVARLLAERHSDWDMAAMGEETEFHRESHYVPKAISGYNQLHRQWTIVEHQLQTESRYLNRSFLEMMDRVFPGIENFQTREGASVIENIGPSSETRTLYRARVFQTEESLTKALSRPDLEVGPPPIGQAAAGRMNASGISVFYGALVPSTAIAEVRPPVGSDVVVATFEITRPLRVLNLAALRQIMIRKSYFDPDCRPLQERVAFLEILGNKMTRPVMPEREHADYLVTQVIADYLASAHQLDGILYPSVQVAADLPAANRTNVVLFHRASRVERIEIPQGTEISVDWHRCDDDGDDLEFWVRENVPAPTPSPTNDRIDPLGLNTNPQAFERFRDHRQDSLRLLIDAVSVHHVDAVHFATDERPVRRLRIGPQTAE